MQENIVHDQEEKKITETNKMQLMFDHKFQVSTQNRDNKQILRSHHICKRCIYEFELSARLLFIWFAAI